ncbi:Polyadenylate-binding protein, cytoplasmic and nuclear [Thelohanellus kitauei]|uniref:Polyadenylate-binding protein, cytoplasmic and nuclear n=1 Tax=Thelohanellus kitauei TaxID=669202 RepID=A0A0C2NC68_THEKT|nr:Polyadenylate-binding protein, cytoplasmic and nuclear [Thelohanellus kitauei]
MEVVRLVKNSEDLMNTSLFIADLKPEVTDEMLWNIVSRYGHVVTFNIHRDMMTQASLGCAYVTYLTSQEAENASKALNQSEIHGKQCRVMRYLIESKNQFSGILCIKDIDHARDPMSLHNEFSKFGPIASTGIVYDINGVSTGCSIIQFEDDAHANHARQMTNCVEFSNMMPCVYKYVRKYDGNNSDTINSNKFTDAFISNFIKDSMAVDSKNVFEKRDDKSVSLHKNENNESGEYGFIKLADHTGSETADIEMNGSNLDNSNEINVVPERKFRDDQADYQPEVEQTIREIIEKKSLNLYVKHFDKNMTDDELHDLFREFGQIKSAHVMKDDKNISRCFGFVCFTKPDDAQKAIESMHNKFYKGRYLYVAYAQTKQERQNTIEQQILNNYLIGQMMAAPVYILYIYSNEFHDSPQKMASWYQWPGAIYFQQISYQHGSNQARQQYDQGVQRGAYYQRNHRTRGNISRGIGRSRKYNYQNSQYKSEIQPLRVTVTLESTQNVPLCKSKDVNAQTTIIRPDPCPEFKNKISEHCSNTFQKYNFNQCYFNRVYTKVVISSETEVQITRTSLKKK